VTDHASIATTSSTITFRVTNDDTDEILVTTVATSQAQQAGKGINNIMLLSLAAAGAFVIIGGIWFAMGSKKK